MFIQNKYTKWYHTIIDRARMQNRKKGDGNYYESHHIIPRCMGGVDQVLLTAKEHFVCHLLLCRMLSGSNKHKMINALIKLAYSKSKGQQRYTSNSYALVRKLIAEKNSEMFKGVTKSEKVKKNMKGRSGKWVRTKEYNESRSGKNNPRYGKPGTFTGKKFTREMAEKRAKTRKERGIKPPFTGKGYRHYTNGIEDRRFIPGTELDGFYLGRTKNRKR